MISKDELRRLYITEWQTPNQIAKQFGVTGGTITYWLTKYGIPPHTNRIRGMDKETLERLYVEKRWSTNKIAAHFNCNDETVRKALQRNDVSVRSKSEAGKLKEFSPEHTEKLRQRLSQYNKGLFGSDHPAWKGGRQVNSYGYVMLRMNGKYVLEHRYVMEQHHGRKLTPWEEVNHINGIRTDNRVDNLEVIYSEHKHKDWKRRNGVVA